VNVLKAEIEIDYNDEKIAEAIADAVSPDNFKTPRGLSVKTKWKDGKVLTKIRCKTKLSTFIATIDDLLFYTSTAEKILQTTRKLE
jgi:tRNA threonylcarbamoyladenosine modification (KEOPS) complex  Pcc1 subunit